MILPPTYKSPAIPTPPLTINAPVVDDTELVGLVITTVVPVIPPAVKFVEDADTIHAAPFHTYVLPPTTAVVPVLGFVGKLKIAMFLLFYILNRSNLNPKCIGSVFDVLQIGRNGRIYPSITYPRGSRSSNRNCYFRSVK